MILETLSQYIPPEASDHVQLLWDQYPFKLKITKERVSKLGDYRYDPTSDTHMITVNGSLNRYAFLITLIHEIAHQHVRIHYKRVQPHGSEWKTMFRDLMLPFLRPSIFPDDILRQLASHMRNPKASSSADHDLTHLLESYDKVPNGDPVLQNLYPGERFVFRGREYRLIKHRRTRSICEERKSGRRYLVPMICKVRPVM